MIQHNNEVSFYSGYAYLRPVVRGSVTSHDNGFGSQELDDTVAIPASVTLRPPYVQYYIEYPTGTFRPVGKPGDVLVGNDDNNLRFLYKPSDIPFGDVFTCHYVIFDRISTS